MRDSRIPRLSAFLALVLAALCCFGQKTVTLEIYHTNDTHSRIEPLPASYGDSLQADKAGVLRRLAYIEQERRKDPELILLDCGDFSQGSPYYNLFKGDCEIDFMNLLGYDATTIGNHEFDFGLENMHRIFSRAKFPVVNCNYTVKGTPIENDVKPYVIIRRKGLRIGILGVGPELKGLVQEKNYVPMRYLSPAESAQKVVDTLRGKEKCDLVICLSHLGWKSGFDDRRLVGETEGIDIVLGGHTHTYFKEPEIVRNRKGKDVPVYQMGKNAWWVGHFTVTMKK